METEGNVAAALTDLMENCAGGKRKLMVETLQRNPGTIHSFSEFRDRLGCPFPKLFPVTVASVDAGAPETADLLRRASRGDRRRRSPRRLQTHQRPAEIAEIGARTKRRTRRTARNRRAKRR